MERLTVAQVQRMADIELKKGNFTRAFDLLLVAERARHEIEMRKKAVRK